MRCFCHTVYSLVSLKSTQDHFVPRSTITSRLFVTFSYAVLPKHDLDIARAKEDNTVTSKWILNQGSASNYAQHGLCLRNQIDKEGAC